MDVIQENYERFTEIVNRKRYNINAFCNEILKISPNQSVDWLARDFCKYVAYACLNINPAAVDINAENVINEFILQTKMLTDFRTVGGGQIKDFLQTQNEAAKACFGVFICKRLKETNKELSFEGSNYVKKGTSYVLGLFGVPQDVSDSISDKSIGFVDQFFNWLSGGGGGNQTVGQIYYFWKYQKGQPYYGQDIRKENISENFKKEWIPKIENESGVNHDVLEKYFERDYDKIRVGYWNTQNDWFASVKKQVDENLRNGKQPFTSGSRNGILSKLFSFLR